MEWDMQSGILKPWESIFFTFAFQSHRSDMILRISVPYSGFSEYLPMLLPAALVSFLAALACAFVFTRRFVDSVTRPLQDIVSELQKVKGGNGELHFSPCPYQELNVIAETTMEMSNNVKDYLNRIEKEKQIRQEFFSNASHELKTPNYLDPGLRRADGERDDPG